MSNPETPSSAFWAGRSNETPAQRYRTLVNAVGDGLYRLDGDGRIVGANDALVEMTGYSRNDLHEEHVSLLLSDADIERIDRALSDADETMVTVGIKTADGGAVPCELHVTSAADGQVGVVRDDSVDDDTADARTPQGSVTNIIDEADIGVFVLDDTLDVAWIDETVEQYFGVDRDALLGRDKREVVTEQIQHRIEQPERFAETVLATYDDNSYVEQFECRVTPSEDREGRWLEHYSKPIEAGPYAGGRIELYYDISDRKESEGDLRDTVEQFQSLVDAVEEYAIFRLDTDGTVISWNEGAAAIKGYDADDILGEHFSTFYTEEDRAAGVPEYNLEQASEHGSVEDEGWRVRQDGSRFWANVTISEVRDDDGTHRGYLKVTRDMTDRYMRERELESELERVLGRISDAFYAVDEEFRFTHVNERAEQLLGSSAEELEGTVMWDVFPESFGSAHYEQFQHAMAEQEPVSFERYMSTLDIWAEVNLYPSETGLSVYLLDVTDRNEREQELRRTDRRFEAVFEDPNILVGLLAPDGTVRDINQTAMEYIDADLVDVRGDLFWETPWWGTDDAVRADVREWTERAADGEYVDFEADITGPDGQRSISGFFRPVVDDDGEVTSIIVSDRDVTERKEHEQELELFRSLLDKSNDAVIISNPENGRILDVNDTAIRRLGYDREELLQRTIPDIETEFETGDDWEAFVEELRDAGQMTFDGFHERSDGTEFPVEVEVSHVELDREYVLSMARDVTERKERKRRLEVSEQRYRTLAEYFPNGIVTLFDHDLRYELAAGQGFDEVPVDPDEVRGKHFSEVWDDEAVDALEPAFEAALDGEERSVELEYAGREWVFRAVPITDERGEVFAGMTMAMDITERKERERYLEDVKSRLEAATEAGAVGTWEWQIPEDKMVVGESFAETFGIDPEAARAGVSLDLFIDAIHEADRDRVEEKIQTAVGTCGEYEAEYRVLNADGEYRWVVARGHVECEDGEPVRFPGTLTDITERKRAELELQQSNEQLEALFEVLPVGVLVAEADGELVSANDTAKEIWGGDVFDVDSVEEYERYPVYWADSGDRVVPEEMTLARVVDGETVDEPDVFEIEAEDGENRIIEAKGRPIYDDGGEVVRGVVTISDVTERREYERKLEESNERLEQFAYAASHDLQEPLRMVSSYLQLLEDRYDDVLDEDGREFLEFAVDGADRMKAMIDGLLAYSRIETRGNPMEPTDLTAVLDDVRMDLQFRIEESDATITSDTLPTVVGDEDQLRQVFQNLLENAIEYSGDAPPQVHVSAEREGDRWRLAVEDEGIGIDPGDQDRVFEVFQRLHARDEHEGTGIGLALCKRIVERHGGEISVDSEPDEGATFSFTLPAVDGGE